MKAYLDALTKVNVLTAKQAEWQEDVTYYYINTGFEIVAFDEDIEYPVISIAFDADEGEVVVTTATPAEDYNWWRNREITITDKNQLLIKQVKIVTLEELQG